MRGEDLLAAVLAEPEDWDRRLVYADWLQSKGDPRGEFIALQLARHRAGGPASKRERQLEKRYGRRWLASLEPHVLPSGLTYERGFVRACRSEATTHPDFLGHPLLSTVTAFDACGRVALGEAVRVSAAALIHPVMRSLRFVVGLRAATLSQIVTKGHVTPWTHAGIDVTLEAPMIGLGLLAGEVMSASFPHLRSVSLHQAKQALRRDIGARFIEATRARITEMVVVSQSLVDAADWFFRAGAHLEAMTLCPEAMDPTRGWTFVFAREGHGRATMTASFQGELRPDLVAVMTRGDSIELLRDAGVNEFRLDVSRSSARGAEQGLRAALERVGFDQLIAPWTTAGGRRGRRDSRAG